MKNLLTMYCRFFVLFLSLCVSLADTTKDQYVEEVETGAYESRMDESLLIQQKPVSRGKLEARADSIRVQNST